MMAKYFRLFSIEIFLVHEPSRKFCLYLEARKINEVVSTLIKRINLILTPLFDLLQYFTDNTEVVAYVKCQCVHQGG